MSNTNNLNSVMVVDDDPTTLIYLRTLLAKNNYHVTEAISASSARAKFEEIGFDRFLCLLTDHRMPLETGLDLINWLQQQDPTLATIIATADGQKSLVEESLRSGAVDFLEKPIAAGKLLAAVNRAGSLTQHRRNQARSESAVKGLGQTQSWMVYSNQKDKAEDRLYALEICFHPKLDAGGGFISHFESNPGTFCYLVSDVSGHDLQAAYISAYFQGIVRGMSQCATAVADIFSFFNRFLVEEWNGRKGLSETSDVKTSLAVSAVTIDFNLLTASILNNGAPPPVYFSRNGRITSMGTNGGPPLGWFNETDSVLENYAIEAGSTIMLWTDGLEDLALEHDVSPLCIAYILEKARQSNSRPAILEDANDDIMLASIRISPKNRDAMFFYPLMFDFFCGDDADEIDSMVEAWRRTIRLAVPDIGEYAEHDLLLSCREAMLNALKHGCQGKADRKASIQISYSPEAGWMKVWVEDPGNGHQFDFIAHCHNPHDSLPADHRGLLFIVNLADSVEFQRNGATVIMGFNLQKLNISMPLNNLAVTQ